jgi:D-alanyl-D-alanine carboxypeptidase
VMTFVLEPSPPHGLIGIRVEDMEGPAAPGSAGGAKTTVSAFITATSAYVDSLSRADEFSGVVQVTRLGKPLIQMARGYADREREIRNDLMTRFNIGSINKTFTAIAIHQRFPPPLCRQTP